MKNNNLIKSILIGFVTFISCYLISLLIASILKCSIKNVLFIAGVITAFTGAFPFIKGSGGFYQWAPSFMASQTNAEEVSNAKKSYGYSANYKKTVTAKLNFTALFIFIDGILIMFLSFIN